MTDSLDPLHQASMGAMPLVEPAADSGLAALDFESIYAEHFDFIWRSLRRLGVRDSAIDDATQDVFLVAHQRLHTFRGESTLKTWLFGIAYRVARKHRPGRPEALLADDVLEDTTCRSPHDITAEEESRRLLYQLLQQLDEDRRAVFILAELEDMSAPEVAEALGIKLNTVYSRLRLARADFEAQVRRHRAQLHWRTR